MRNRDLALDAAMALLAEPGAALTVGAIAERAGLGAGTVVRAFGGKDALLDAAVARLLEPVVQRARDLLAETTPYQALRAFLRELIAFQAAHHAANDQLAGLDLPLTTALRADLVGAVERMIEGARRSGQIRTDLDLPVTTALTSATALAVARTDPDLADAYLTVFMDGLSTPNNSTVGADRSAGSSPLQRTSGAER
ncbi:TetR/AcrR family transcriptional regulator [Actinomadura verrucosospora]|uniref:TetR/AcrR family transcriptional regulator n=1 Tax=Actinomadura verrucosospora TaxID=46165 RepID=UPI001567C110|nr:TetR/AcrR family transcriptional regulator [Actinomadura verrucosospora]